MSDTELLNSIRHLERLNAEAEASQAPPDNPAPGAVIRPAEDWQPVPPVLIQRPGADPAPSDQRRLRYDPITKKMVSVLQ